MGSYLVTGAAGFIASKVSELLLEAGHRVTGVDNLNDAYDVRLKRWRLERLGARERFQFHELDICRREDLEPLFEEPPDALFNLAARAGVRQSVTDPWVYVRTNVIGNLNLLHLCARSGTPKFILASTSSLYGNSTEMPLVETLSTDRPLSPYAASKKGAEALCHAYHTLHGLDVTVLRYFTVYGPAGRPDMSIFRFIQWISEGRPVRIYGDGHQSRDFTFVEDVARGTIAALRPLGYQVVNLGSDAPVVLLDAIRMVEEKVGRSAELVFSEEQPADVRATWAGIDKARRLLDWQPRESFSSGIQKAVDWYQENRSWARDVSTED